LIQALALIVITVGFIVVVALSVSMFRQAEQIATHALMAVTSTSGFARTIVLENTHAHTNAAEPSNTPMATRATAIVEDTKQVIVPASSIFTRIAMRTQSPLRLQLSSGGA
jgi:hypothetical protein